MNRLGEPVFMAGPKHMRTEFGIHLRFDSCAELKRMQHLSVAMYIIKPVCTKN